MATRLDILEAFYSELLAATSGLVAPEDISLINNDDLETTPSVVYDKNFRLIDYNGASSAPDSIDRDTNGDVLSENFNEYNEGQFFIHIRADSQGQLEPIYEAIHTHFQRWKFARLKPINTFHADAESLEVREINSADDPSGEATFRGDVLEVVIEFKREYRSEGDLITDVTHDVNDQTYTTN